MALELTNLPGAYNLSGNFPVLMGTAGPGESMLIDLIKGSELVIRERYYPDADGNLNIDLGEVIDSVLSLQLPGDEDLVFDQASAYGSFTINYGPGEEETESNTFKVVKAGSDQTIADAQAFLNSNFLTWQPQEKRIKAADKEWLTYYSIGARVVKVKAYFADAEPVIITLANLLADKHNTIDVSYSLIDSFTPEPPTSPIAYDVWVENNTGTRLTNIQRYILTKEYFEFDELFVFQNTAGGIDTIRFTGERTDRNEVTARRALFYKTTLEIQNKNLSVYKKNTGIFRTMEERLWVVEFFKSINKFVRIGDTFQQIYVTDVKLESKTHEINDGEFEYAVALDNQYYSVERNMAELPAPHQFPPDAPPAEGIFTDQFTDEFQ